MDSFDDDSYSSASSLQKEEAEEAVAHEKNVEGVGVKPPYLLQNEFLKVSLYIHGFLLGGLVLGVL